MQPDITQSFHIQQCLEVAYSAAADNGYEQAWITYEATEHFLDLLRNTDLSRTALEWNEGAVAIEKKSDFLCFSQPGQDSMNVSKCVFWPAGPRLLSETSANRGGFVSPFVFDKTPVLVVDQILGSEYL